MAHPALLFHHCLRVSQCRLRAIAKSIGDASYMIYASSNICRKLQQMDRSDIRPTIAACMSAISGSRIYLSDSSYIQIVQTHFYAFKVFKTGALKMTDMKMTDHRNVEA